MGMMLLGVGQNILHRAVHGVLAAEDGAGDALFELGEGQVINILGIGYVTDLGGQGLPPSVPRW